MKKQPLQTMVKSYTIPERSTKIYNLVVNVFDYNKSSDIITPLELVEKQVDQAISVKPDATYLVPGAGIGTYVSVLITKGVKPSSIYAVEIDPAYYELGDGIFKRFGVNYVHTDFLIWQPNMKFDVIVGNPPYQRSREVRNIGAPLWPDFIERSMELVCDGGIVSLVVPFTWMQKNTRSKAWKVIKKYDLVSLNPCVDDSFPNVQAGGITIITLVKQPYSGKTKLPDGSFIDILSDTPSNNKSWNVKEFDFLRDQTVLNLDLKNGPIHPSINSDHWSPVKTETHCYEIFYSTSKKRRSMWCDQPIGDYGKLKLAVGTYGDIYNTIQITEDGCGRQVEYVLGTKDELEKLKELLLSDNSKRMSSLKSYGSYHSPLSNVVKPGNLI